MPQKPISIESQEYRQLVANGQKLDELGLMLKAAHDLIDAIADRFAGLLGAQTVLLQQIADDLAPDIDRTTTAAIAFGGTIMSATPGTLAVGSTLTASFVPLMADGTVNTTSKLTTPPTWASSDLTIAIVDAVSGVVIGVAAGTATITGTGGSFTDSDNTVVGPLDASNTVSDTAPVQRTVSAQVNFA